MTLMLSFIVMLAVGYLVIVAAAAVAGALARGGRRERAVDAYEALAVSRFTIPVSLIVASEDDGAPLGASLRSLLGLNYPELEVVVVADALSETRLDELKGEWGLEPKELFYRRTLDTAAVRRIYASARDPRLLVVEKTPGGRADALNCGVSLARYRYVVTVSPEIACDRDALLRLMSPALRDPATVLAVTSYIERRSHAVAEGADAVAWTTAADDYQRLASIRSWMASRLAWHQLRCGLPPLEGVVAWRRDAVFDLGGFSTSAADPELDLLVRLQASQAGDSSARVVRTSEVFGHAGATSQARHATIAARRRRAVRQALQTTRQAPAGSASPTLIFVLLIELLTPAAQVVVLAGTIAGALAGLLPWTTPFIAGLVLTFGYGLMSASALLLRGGAPDAPIGHDLRRLLLRAPLELPLTLVTCYVRRAT